MKFPYFLKGGSAIDPPEIKFLTATEVFFLSGVMFLLGTYAGRFLNKLFPNYNPDKKNYVQAVEVILQAGTTGALTYIMRELMIAASISLFGPTDQLSQSTGYAATLYAFGLLSTQSELKKKLQHLLPLNENTENEVVQVVSSNAPMTQQPILENSVSNRDVINQRMEEHKEKNDFKHFSGTGMDSFGNCGRGSGRKDCFDNQEGFASCGRGSGRRDCFTDGNGNDNSYGQRDYTDDNQDREEFSSCGYRSNSQDTREDFYGSCGRANSNNNVSGSPDNVGSFYGGLNASPFDFDR